LKWHFLLQIISCPEFNSTSEDWLQPMLTITDMTDDKSIDGDVLSHEMPLVNIAGEKPCIEYSSMSVIETNGGQDIVRQNEKDLGCITADERAGNNGTDSSQLASIVTADGDNCKIIHGSGHANSFTHTFSSSSSTCSYESESDHEQGKSGIFSAQIQSDEPADKQPAALLMASVSPSLPDSVLSKHALPTIAVNSPDEQLIDQTAFCQMTKAKSGQLSAEARLFLQNAADCATSSSSFRENLPVKRQSYQCPLLAVAEANYGNQRKSKFDLTDVSWASCLDVESKLEATTGSQPETCGVEAEIDTCSAHLVDDDKVCLTDCQMLKLVTCNRNFGAMQRNNEEKQDAGCEAVLHPSDALNLPSQSTVDNIVNKMLEYVPNRLLSPTHSLDDCQSVQPSTNLTAASNVAMKANTEKEDVNFNLADGGSLAAKSVIVRENAVKGEGLDLSCITTTDTRGELDKLNSSSSESGIGVSNDSSFTFSQHFIGDKNNKGDALPTAASSLCSYSGHIVNTSDANKSADLEKSSKVHAAESLPTKLYHHLFRSSQTKAPGDSMEVADIDNSQPEAKIIQEDHTNSPDDKRSDQFRASFELSTGDSASTASSCCEFGTEQSNLQQEISFAVVNEDLMQDEYECDDSSGSDGDGDGEWEEVEG
jgi:hypothetical protein